MNIVDLVSQINDKLVTAYCKAQQRSQCCLEFMKIFHNGRADAFHDAQDILLNIKEDILLSNKETTEDDTKQDTEVSDPWYSSSETPIEFVRVLIYPYPVIQSTYVAYFEDGEWYSNYDIKIPQPTYWRYLSKGPTT